MTMRLFIHVEARRVHVGPDIDVLREFLLLRKLGRVPPWRICGELQQDGKCKQGVHVSSPMRFASTGLTGSP